MNEVFKKLNLKEEPVILVLNAPKSFEAELASLTHKEVLRSVEEADEIDFVLAFVTKQAEVDMLSQAILAKTAGDALLWFAYPKGSSKKYKCDFNRDTGWTMLNGMGWQGVRMVAIDDDWSALRFRNTEYIKG